MAPETRRTVESGLGRDLSHVRVHDDAASRQAAGDLNARAFTHGNDIWIGDGESDRDVQLMAHESAHVLQQQQPVRRKLVQRTPATAPAPDGTATEFESQTNKGKIDTSGDGTITLPVVQAPSWKMSGPDGLSSQTSNLSIPKTGERSTTQVKQWEDNVKGEISSAMNTKLDGSDVIKVGGKRQYFLSYATSNGYLIGSKGQIKKRARRPDWDDSGKPHFYDVDHFQEIQLGGDDGPSNFWLLDAEANQTSGSKINSEITKRVNDLLTEAKPWIGSNAPSSGAAARKSYAITITKLESGLKGTSGDPTAYWTKTKVEAGKPVDALDVMSEDDAKKANLIGPGAETNLTIFTSARGGASVQLEWDPNNNQPVGSVDGLELFPDFKLSALSWNGSTGSLTGVGFRDNRWFPELPITLDLSKYAALPQAATVNGRNIESKIRALTMNGLSPVEITFAEMRDDVGLYARGLLKPSLPIFKGTEIDLIVQGPDVTFQKQFTGDEFQLPGPIKVTETSLILGAGTRGLTVDGEAQFEIERLGKGKLAAAAGANAGGVSFAVEGEFEFDTELFSKAKVKAWYRESKFGAEGQLEIAKGKIKGIDGAKLDVKIEEDKIDATGEVDVAIKGVDKGSMSLSYSEAEGMAIGGELALSGDVPGIESGTLTASMKKGPEGPWKLGGSITAKPSIPGISSQISGEYDDGAWTVQGSAAYAKGLLSGSVTVGATNREVSDEGVPSGDATETVSAFGQGTVTVKIAPWLQGTVGLKIKPNGEVIVSGEVGIPDTLDIFPEKKIEKNIFSVNLDIPIVGLAVAGQRVGIFATIGGGLDASAGIGPGQLRQLNLSIQYNPDNEADTKVTGGAQLYIPAHAGLRMFIRGGIGAGIPLVSATAGLEIGGELGVEGAAEANVAVDWTPENGLALDADVGVHAQPTFKFDVTGFVEVTFDYLIDTATLYEKRFQLAGFEYGSGMRFGIKFPFHYQEGEPFDVSLDDVEFEYPEIDAGSLLSGLVGQIA